MPIARAAVPWAQTAFVSAHERSCTLAKAFGLDAGVPKRIVSRLGPLATRRRGRRRSRWIRLRGCVRSGTRILPVGLGGIGILPMSHGLEAHATMSRLLTHPLRVSSYCVTP